MYHSNLNIYNFDFDLKLSIFFILQFVAFLILGYITCNIGAHVVDKPTYDEADEKGRYKNL